MLSDWLAICYFLSLCVAIFVKIVVLFFTFGLAVLMWQLCMICTAAKTIRMNQNYDRPNAHSKQQKKQNCLFVWYKCNQLTCERHIFLPLLFSFTFDGYRMWWLVEYDFHVSYVYFYSSLKKLLGSFFFFSLSFYRRNCWVRFLFCLSSHASCLLIGRTRTFIHQNGWNRAIFICLSDTSLFHWALPFL